MNIDQIRAKLANCNITALSKELGVHRNGLYRIANGQADPSYSTLKKLENYFNA